MNPSDLKHNIEMFHQFPLENREGEAFKCDVTGNRISEPYDSQTVFNRATRAAGKYGSRLLGRETTSENLVDISRQTFFQAIRHPDEYRGRKFIKETLKRFKTLESSYDQSKKIDPEHKKISEELAAIRRASEIEIEIRVTKQSRKLAKLLTSDSDKAIKLKTIQYLENDLDPQDFRLLLNALTTESLISFIEVYGNEEFSERLLPFLSASRQVSVAEAEIAKIPDPKEVASKLDNILNNDTNAKHIDQILRFIKDQSEEKLIGIFGELTLSTFERIANQYRSDQFFRIYKQYLTDPQKTNLLFREIVNLEYPNQMAIRLMSALEENELGGGSQIKLLMEYLIEDIGKEGVGKIISFLNDSSFKRILRTYGRNEFVDSLFRYFALKQKTDLRNRIPKFNQYEKAVSFTAQTIAKDDDLVMSSSRILSTMRQYNLSDLETQYFLTKILNLAGREKMGQMFLQMYPPDLKKIANLMPDFEMGSIVKTYNDSDLKAFLKKLEQVDKLPPGF